jgi:hypothetical protein
MSAECRRRGRGGFCCARRTMRRRERFACNARKSRVSFRAQLAALLSQAQLYNPFTFLTRSVPRRTLDDVLAIFNDRTAV